MGRFVPVAKSVAQGQININRLNALSGFCINTIRKAGYGCRWQQIKPYLRQSWYKLP